MVYFVHDIATNCSNQCELASFAYRQHMNSYEYDIQTDQVINHFIFFEFIHMYTCVQIEPY